MLIFKLLSSEWAAYGSKVKEKKRAGKESHPASLNNSGWARCADLLNQINCVNKNCKATEAIHVRFDFKHQVLGQVKARNPQKASRPKLLRWSGDVCRVTGSGACASVCICEARSIKLHELTTVCSQEKLNASHITEVELESGANGCY